MKGKRTPIEVSLAISDAVKACDVDVISAYPITPQTHIVEHLSEIVANGELDAEFIKVESEQTAMAACIGAAAMGARTFTATASQGLSLMSEIVFIASSLRMPIVMVLANRSLSGPISIWNDHSDVMSCRDCGWVQVFAENGQEAHDLTIIAYRIGEDKRVILPVMVNLDGFMLTHIIEPIYLLDTKEVQEWLPPYEPVITLDPDHPVTMGPVGVPDIYTESKKQELVAINESLPVVREVFEDFGKTFGRTYNLIETYLADDADILLVIMGGLAETAKVAIDHMREKGWKVGSLRFRLWRPFPLEDFLNAVKNCKGLAVIDRAINFGGAGNPVLLEVKGALYGKKDAPIVTNFTLGLGGRDVPVDLFEEPIKKTMEAIEGKPQKDFEILGLRE